MKNKLLKKFYKKLMQRSSLKRKNDFTESFTKRIKVNNVIKQSNKRKNSEYKNSNNKKLKVDHTTIIEETILLIECGMCSKKMLDECKGRYTNYIKNKDMKEFLNLMKCKKTIEDEMNLYRLVYKIEKSLLNLKLQKNYL